MELGLNNSLLAGDQRLVDHIVGEVKSQGIFDQFRKECLADVDTKPAYQNLRTRVESSVNSFLNKQTWKTDLNKNQLRETLRKHIHEAPYLEVGVERIVDQVVHPKVYSVFMPQVEDVVYKFLGIERPKSQRNGTCDLKDLLPKDLDPVSPESDRNSLKDISLESMDENIAETFNGEEQEKSVNTNCQEKEQDAEEALKEKEADYTENGDDLEIPTSSPVKAVLNSSFKSDETNKTEEEEEESPVFEPIDSGNLNESNMSNDSHLSGISELTSHRSRSPDFMTEFSRDNFDNSNQDSQLSKVSSNSRLSIVTDFGSSNHASTPAPESKEDSKYTKDNFKDVRELDSSKDKFNFEVIKSKESSKSISSKESSRDASEYKDSKSKEEIKSRNSKDKQDSRTNKDKDQNSRRGHSRKQYSTSKSKDKNEPDSQEIRENSEKIKESKVKESEKKDESSKEVKDLKDLYKEKIRELREKKELSEKEKLGKDKDSSKGSKESREKKDFSSSREKDDYKKGHKSSSSSSSRSSSYHNSKSSKSSESKESRDKNSNKRDDRHHSNGKSESRSNSRSKRDSRSESKSDSRSSDRSVKDKKRRDEKKSKPTDDHSSLRKNYNDRRSTDRDGSNGSSSKYSHKSPYGANNSSGKLGPTTNVTKDNSRDHHSSGETTDNIHDSLEMMFANDGKNSANHNSNNPPKRVDPGTAEICLPLKKRPLLNDDSSSEESKPEAKKLKVADKKTTKRKIEKDIFKIDTDVASVPDEERVQIIEVPDEDYENPYSDEEPILSLEETTKIILDDVPVRPMQSKLSEMEQSIRQSLNEMMGEHKLKESEDTIASTKLTPVIDSSTLLETLTDDSNNDSEDLAIAENSQEKAEDKKNGSLNVNADEVQKDVNIEQNEEKDTDMQNNEKIKENVQVDVKMSDYKVEEKEQFDQSHETNVKQVKSDIQTNKIQFDQESTENAVVLNDDKEENTADVNMTDDKEKEREEPKDVDVKQSTIQEEKVSDEVAETSIISKPSIENVDQDEDSTDDTTDEFNEDHKLVIDEEFDEKESNNDNEINVSSENESTNEMLTKSRKNYESNIESDKFEESKDDDKCQEFDVRKIKEVELQETLTDKSSDDESMDDDDIKIIKIKEVDTSEKPVEYTEDVQKNIKDRLIDELGKLNEDESYMEKAIDNEVLETPDEEKIIPESLAQVECIEVDKDNDFEKFDEHAQIIQVNETEQDNAKVNDAVPKDENNELSHDEDDDDDDEDKSNELIIICEEKEEAEQELTLIFNEDSNNKIKASTSSSRIKVDNNIDTILEKEEVQESRDTMQDEKIDQPTTSKGVFSRSAVVVSPFEEDCLYLESQQSNQKYLKFKKFLEKLEADPNRSLEDMIESYGGVVVSAMSMAAPSAPSILKRKPSTSPVSDIVATNTTNNNIEGSVKDNSTDEVGDDAVSSMKKRKVGRTKKTSISSSTSSSTSTTSPLSQQQPLQQPQQQPQLAIVNGENFVMPLSPDSDVSANSDKNAANVFKDERSHRSGHSRSSQQRYSSDDLYKPRPLFSSTSRRNRRFNQA
ncbi:hypothetical protein TSAR_012323 [Trichomalopsis sarcophagae]|uniref:BOD1/SHG1 domain-containing protein n=1 Tax=Trichomalopsis sarcophagae TaxID=543379 RepID=A0A232FGZ9_9HYME|nr:hypothetical protein TSAR_012323 [Trichomalopsis sarcophagae]